MEHHVTLEMTAQMSMPADLEKLMASTVAYGLEDEEALEDTVLKVQEYRALFGVGGGSNQHPRVIQGFKTTCEPILLKVVDEVLPEPVQVVKPEPVVPKKEAPKKEAPKKAAPVKTAPVKAEPKAIYTPVVRTRHGHDEFTTVGEKQVETDSEDEFRIPYQLVLNFAQIDYLQAFKGLPAWLKDQIPANSLKTNQMKEDLKSLTGLFTNSSETNGWAIPQGTQMVLAHLRRDQDELDDSEVWANFKSNRTQKVQVEALLYVPRRVVLGLSKRVHGQYELPFTVLFKNDWATFQHTKELYDVAVGRRGAPFNGFATKTGTVRGAFCDSAVTAFCVKLPEPVVLQGQTKIVY